MMPNTITLLFSEAHEVFPPFKGKPMDDNLMAIREVLLPILMVIPNDQLGGIHSLTAILTELSRYAADHGGFVFQRPACLPIGQKHC